MAPKSARSESFKELLRSRSVVGSLKSLWCQSGDLNRHFSKAEKSIAVFLVTPEGDFNHAKCKIYLFFSRMTQEHCKQSTRRRPLPEDAWSSSPWRQPCPLSSETLHRLPVLHSFTWPFHLATGCCVSLLRRLISVGLVFSGKILKQFHLPVYRV